MAEVEMVVLATGGLGFVMSNAVRYLLKTNPRWIVVNLDLSPVTGMAAEFFKPVAERLFHIQGDIRDRALLDHLSDRWHFTHVLHGATLSHSSLWERQQPSRYVEVNVMGTLSLLDWARPHALDCFLYVSSGAVYGTPTGLSPLGLQPEDGPFNPPELYAVSKYTAELIVRRYGQLFAFKAPRVRFSAVFGPMERPTPSRPAMSLPYQMARSVIEGRPLRLTAATLAAGGDFLSAEDIAPALAALLSSKAPRHEAYNIAFGTFTGVPELLRAFQTAVPAFTYDVVDESEAEVSRDPAQRLARWNTYAIDRIAAEFGWRPRPLTEQFATYWAWVQHNPAEHCPPVAQPAN